MSDEHDPQYPEDEFGEDDEIEVPQKQVNQLALAMMEFNGKFSEYIREMDPVLWKKAIDYAVTFTQIDGITFQYVKTDQEETVVANIEWSEEVIDEESDYDDDEESDLEDDADWR